MKTASTESILKPNRLQMSSCHSYSYLLPSYSVQENCCKLRPITTDHVKPAINNCCNYYYSPTMQIITPIQDVFALGLWPRVSKDALRPIQKQPIQQNNNIYYYVIICNLR